MLKSVPDPRSPQGIQHALVFMLAACVVAALAGARNYREIAGHAADVPQPLLKKLGAKWCWFGLRSPVVSVPRFADVRFLSGHWSAKLFDFQ